MIGIWCVNLLAKINAIDLDNLGKTTDNQNKKKYSLLEFGPGRGTLMIDVIRVKKHKENFKNIFVGSSTIQFTQWSGD